MTKATLEIYYDVLTMLLDSYRESDKKRIAKHVDGIRFDLKRFYHSTNKGR